MAATVVLVGTLDTKAEEYRFVRDQLARAGCDTLLVDVGVLGEPGLEPDLPRAEVAAAGGHDLAALRQAGDRGRAVAAMAEGARAVVTRLHAEGRLQGALALGGTGGTSIAATAFVALPLGVPKLVVSTAAAGDTSGYLGTSDLVLAPSVVDVAGLNRISTPILANAAAAMAGMASAPVPDVGAGTAPLVATSMFGVTTPCLTVARHELERLGYEPLVFHMTGAGGRTMESLAAGGLLAGVLDVTTTELADELVGGVFTAGPDRLTAAAAGGVPQVVSVGALDMVNFGARDTVPERFADRHLHVHNSQITLMRTTPEECAELGAQVATRLRVATAPTSVFLPLRGISAIAVEGGPFHDPDADAALFDAVREGLAGSAVELVERDTDINDPAFAHEMVERLHHHLNPTEQES